MFKEKIDEITKKHNISTISNGNKLGTIDDVYFILISEKYLKEFLENNKGIIKNVYLYLDADGNAILEIDPSRKPNFYVNNTKKKEIFKRNKQNSKTKENLKEIKFKKTTINGDDVVDGFENEFQEYFHDNFYWFEIGGGVRKVLKKNIEDFLNWYYNKEDLINQKNKYEELKQQKIISIDASTRHTAISIFYNKKYVGTENVICDGDINKRFYEMIIRINSLLEVEKPDLIIIEEMVVERNVDTQRFLTRVQGAICLFSALNNCEVIFIRPTEWRKLSKLNEYAKEIFPEKKKLKREDFKVAAMRYVNKMFNLKLGEDESESYLIGMAFLTNDNVL
jgi:hypothetical protein